MTDAITTAMHEASLRELRASLVAAVTSATAIKHGELTALEKILVRVEREIADTEARKVPIAIGGAVSVHSRNFRPGEARPYTIDRIARKYIYLRNRFGQEPEAFDIETGHGKIDSYEGIDANDLARIKTFILEPMAAKKGASK